MCVCVCVCVVRVGGWVRACMRIHMHACVNEHKHCYLLGSLLTLHITKLIRWAVT